MGVIFSDEKAFVLDIFNICLAQNEVENLLSTTCLKRDGFRVTYDLYTSWFVYCPYGGVLKFKKDVGVCK